jgi:flagellar biosynthesis/type III secretory pathway M-ring protein FliF/YscJ
MTSEQILGWATFLWPLIAGAAAAWFGAKEALRQAKAANRRLDEEEKQRQDLRLELRELKIEQKRDNQELEKLRASRHDYIDKELNPQLQRFYNSVEEELERHQRALDAMSARTSALEARPK